MHSKSDFVASGVELKNLWGSWTIFGLYHDLSLALSVPAVQNEVLLPRAKNEVVRWQIV